MIAPNGTCEDVWYTHRCLAGLTLLHACYFFKTQTPTLLAKGRLFIYGTKVPANGTVNSVAYNLVCEWCSTPLLCSTLLCTVGALVILCKLGWPLWLCWGSAALSLATTCAHTVRFRRPFVELISNTRNEVSEIDGIYIKRKFVQSYVRACCQHGFLYVFPLCFLNLCFPLISVSLIHGPNYTFLLLLGLLLTQRAARFRLIIQPQFLQIHLQAGSILAELGTSGLFAILSQGFILPCDTKICPTLRSLCVSLICKLKWGATADKYHIAPLPPGCEALLAKLFLFATVWSTGLVHPACIVQDLCAYSTLLTLFRTQIPIDGRNLIDLVIRVQSNMIMHGICQITQCTFHFICATLRAIIRHSKLLAPILVFSITFAATSRVVSASEVGTLNRFSLPHRCPSAHDNLCPPYRFFTSNFTEFLLSGANLEGNVGITSFPTRFVDPEAATSTGSSSSVGVQVLLQTAPLFRNDKSTWGALIYSGSKSFVLISPVNLVGDSTISMVNRGDCFMLYCGSRDYISRPLRCPNKR